MIKILFSVLSFLLISNVYALNFNERPIQVIMSFPPGGGVDETFRHFENYVSKKGINMVGVYMPGGEGIISTNQFRTMPKNGSVVMITTAAVLATDKIKNPDNHDLSPITMIRASNMAIVTNSNNKIQDFSTFIKSLKSKNYDIKIGIGAPTHNGIIDQIISNESAGASILKVPYKGTNPAINDLLGGHIDIAIAPLNVVTKFIDSGKLKILATTTKVQGTNIVSLVEHYPNYISNEGFIFVLHNDIEPNVRLFYENLLKEYMDNNDVKKSFLETHNSLVPYGSDFANRIINNAIKTLKK